MPKAMFEPAYMILGSYRLLIHYLKTGQQVTELPGQWLDPGIYYFRIQSSAHCTEYKTSI